MNSPRSTWRRMCCSAAVLGLSAVGVLVLAASSELFVGSWLDGGRHHLPSTLVVDEHADVVGTGTAGSGTDGPHTPRGVQELETVESDEDGTLGEGLLKHYSSFAEYALERSNSTASLPVPIVQLIEKESAVSLPIITIIGVEKGGTTSLRWTLLTHPVVSGVLAEVHFFDRLPSEYPSVGQWEGDGLHRDMDVEAAGLILSEYAKLCAVKGKDRGKPQLGIDRVIVDSSPRYSLHPVVPYRMEMVRPGAKFVIVIRDPTDRYYSHLRMNICADPYNDGFSSVEARIKATFHHPGEAKDYLTRAEVDYEPYTPRCRGENASSSDLWDCYKALYVRNPIHRGLYADQLERWFRVFDRSQIMVVDSSDMFTDFNAVVAAVAAFAGLPKHIFKYDASMQHKTSPCSGKHHGRHGPDYFADGGRYDAMLEEEGVLRDWYRPHNERLYKLLGRKLAWR